MKKIKKSILFIFGSIFTLSSVPVSIICSDINKSIPAVENYILNMQDNSNKMNEFLLKEENEKNLKEMKNEINNSFENFSDSKLDINIEKKSSIVEKNNSIFKSNNEILDETTLEYAKNKSLDYYDLILRNEFSLSDLLSMANSQGYSYEKQISDFENFSNQTENLDLSYNNTTKEINKNLYGKISSLDNKKNSNSTLEPISFIADQILKSRNDSIVFATLATAVAAGYWAASIFSFGGTVASAVAATAQAAILAAQAAVYITSYEFVISSKDYNKIKNEYVFLKNQDTITWSLGVAFLSSSVCTFFSTIKSSIIAVKTASLVAKAGVTSTLWASPSAFIIIMIFDISISLASLVTSFF